MNAQLTTQQNAQLERFRRGASQHHNRPLAQFANVHEAAAYALWQRESALEARKIAEQSSTVKHMRRNGLVLTEKGWEIPSGPLNPRVIEQSAVPSPFEAAWEAEVQRQVQGFADAHEHAVNAGAIDYFVMLYRTWELPIRFYFEPVNVQ